ncbi:hypothetical protein [Streptomyces sp. NBC_01465]|uniref:hypothetical protein n=1 Tax=Streptomyces sp. NBC_01465 TaxID=2903878 RepID=UPI002E33201F|nr:hypothetical protein [Streptomyces sp. NBC_01465]
MRHLRILTEAALAAVLLAGTLGAPSAGASETAPPAPVPGPVAVQTPRLTLVTGDEFTVADGPFGRKTATLLPAPGEPVPALAINTDLAGNTYQVPESAAPLVASGVLDRELFNTSNLAAHLSGDGRIPVSIAYADGASPAAIPGITVSGGTSYVTDAGDLGAALRRETSSGHTAELFGSVKRISYAGPAAAEAPDTSTPAGEPTYPLRVKVVRAPGAKMFLDVQLYNVDDFLAGGTGSADVGADGYADFGEVPAGHYAAVARDAVYDADYKTTANYLGDVEITVGADGPVSEPVMDFSSAVPVQIKTPRPAKLQSYTAFMSRGDLKFFAVPVFAASGTAPLYVTRTGTPGPGVFNLSVTATLNGDDYAYRLNFNDRDGIPLDATTETLRARTADLATVDTRYAADEDATATATIVTQTWKDRWFTTADNYATVTVPSRRTEYWSAGETFGRITATSSAVRTARWRTYAPGAHSSDDWGGSPIGHGPQWDWIPWNTATCLACRNGNQLTLVLDPEHDNGEGHLYSAGGITGAHLKISADDLVIHESDQTLGVVQQPVPKPEATYRIAYETERAGARTSTRARTEWTFRQARPTEDTVDRSKAYCFTSEACTALPLLDLRYDLDTDLHNTVNGRVATMELTVSQLGIAQQTEAAGARVEVSYDGGATWHRSLAVRTGTNRFHALWLQPSSAAGTTPALRVTASDSAGNTVTQTVWDAYRAG